MKTCLLTLLLSIQLFSQTVPVTFHYRPPMQSFSTVRIAGSFENWSITDPNYLMNLNSAKPILHNSKSFSGYLSI